MYKRSSEELRKINKLLDDTKNMSTADAKKYMKLWHVKEETEELIEKLNNNMKNIKLKSIVKKRKPIKNLHFSKIFEKLKI